jgi:hypothetical protein
MVNTTQTLNIAGTVTAGFLPADTFTAGGTGAVSLPATYTDFGNLPGLAMVPPAEPIEVVQSLGASGGYNIDEFTGLGITTTVANILNGSQPVGFCCVTVNNLSANNLNFAAEIVFHYEGIPNQAYLNFVPAVISRMTYSEYERVLIEESFEMPRARTIVGKPALDDCDTWCQVSKGMAGLASGLHSAAKYALENETIREAAAAGVSHLTASAVNAAGRSYMAKRHLLLK